MKRVLLVTSSYYPVTIADMHRVRHLAWELPALGWHVDVLHPGVAFQRPEFCEPDAVQLFNPDVETHEAQPTGLRVARLLGVGSIGWRALLPLWRKGSELLSRKQFDLVFISTANFPLFCLGRAWLRSHRVPYVLDYHDPWVREQINYATTPSRWKLRVNVWLAKWMERWAVSSAAALVSVSPIYIHDLRRRYPNSAALKPNRALTIPFGARDADLSSARGAAPRRVGSRREVVYVGAGGAIMAESFTAICRSLAAVADHEPALLDGLRIRILGTFACWKEGEPKPLEELANGLGLGGVVIEEPSRIGYVRALQLAQCSDGLLVLGVDEHGYVPSKLFTYALTGAPLLASLRAGGAAAELMEQHPGFGHFITFRGRSATATAFDVVHAFLREVRSGQRFDRRADLEDYLSPGMARKHAALFDQVRRFREVL
jgi:hypothetical protein